MGKIPLYDWWHKWFSKRNNERFIDQEHPVPVILVNTMGSAGQTIFGSSATAGPTITEANSADIDSTVSAIQVINARSSYGYPMGPWTASGGAIGSSGAEEIKPIPSVVGGGCVITADGAGNIGAAAEVIAAITGEKVDAWMICQVDTTGSYTTKWCEASSSPAVGIPDYHTAGHIAYMVAGYPYLLRMQTTNDAVNIGYDAGVNGNWPNSANMYITGWYRGI